MSGLQILGVALAASPFVLLFVAAAKAEGVLVAVGIFASCLLVVGVMALGVGLAKGVLP